MARSSSPQLKAKAKPLKIGAHSLLKSSLRFARYHFKFLATLVLVAIVVNLVFNFVIGGQVAATYQSLWFGFFSSSLIWSIRHLQAARSRQTLSVTQAYWTGSAPTLKLIIILSLIALASAPFSIGAFLFSTVNYLGANSWATDSIAAVIWLAFALVSLLLLARLCLAIIIVTLPDVGPLKALSLGWRLSRGRTVGIAKRLAIGFAYGFLLFATTAFGLAIGGVSTAWIQTILGVLSLGVVLPLFYIYLFLLYKELA